MKKIIVFTLIVSIFLMSTPFVRKVSANDSMSVRDFVNLLITIGVITPDKIPSVNAFLASLNNNQIATTSAAITQSQSTQATTTIITSAPCTPGENTKVLDNFIAAHPEYQLTNDPTSIKWNFFRNIYHSYNPTNVCPQQLQILLEKAQTEFEDTYSPSQTTASQQQSTQIFLPTYNTTNYTGQSSQNAAILLQQQEQQQQLQKVQDSLDQMKRQQEAQRQQQQFQQQLLQMRPNCNQVSFYDRLSLSGGCNN